MMYIPFLLIVAAKIIVSSKSIQKPNGIKQ
jgi:hypothetical protein